MIQRSKIAQRILEHEEKTLLWATKYTPIDRKDIPLYKESQISKFENLLNICLNRLPNSPKVIVITGPVGCGKTTLVNVICKEKKIQIIKFTPDDDYFMPGYNSENTKSPFIIKLKLFLERCQTVINPNQKQLLLIDDITLNQDDRNDFYDVITQYNINPRPLFPLIWIADQNDTQKKIFGCYYYSFPAAPRSVLKRVIKRVSQMQHINLNKDQFEAFIDENPGDVRLAVNMLQFARTFSTGKYNYLSYFQAIGEILYQKYKHSPEDILKISHCSPHMMIRGLFENSLDFFADVSEYADCAEEFSSADVFLGMSFMSPELTELATTTAMRGVLTSLQTRQGNRFFEMRHGSKSHLGNNFSNDLYHQELIIEDLLMREDNFAFNDYFNNSNQNNESFVCWPSQCKNIDSKQMDSMLFDDNSRNVQLNKLPYVNQMEKERENKIKEELLSQAMSLLSIDPIDMSNDDFFSD